MGSMRGRRSLGPREVLRNMPTGQFGGKDLVRMAQKHGMVKLQSGVVMPTQQFVSKMIKAEQKVLYKAGRYAMRTYKSLLRRKPPARYTKASLKRAGEEFQRQAHVKGKDQSEANNLAKRKLRYTKRFKKEQNRKGAISTSLRPPYMRTGKLRNQVAFRVLANNVYCGPPLDESLSAYQMTMSQQKIPGLLDKGGPARVTMWIRRQSGTRKKIQRVVNFRPHPYVAPAWKKTMPVMKKEMHNMLHYQ